MAVQRLKFRNRSEVANWLEDCFTQLGLTPGLGARAERHLDMLASFDIHAVKDTAQRRYEREIAIDTENKVFFVELHQAAMRRSVNPDGHMLQEDAVDRMCVLLLRRDWTIPENAKFFAAMDRPQRRCVAEAILKECTEQNIVKIDPDGSYIFDRLSPQKMRDVSAQFLEAREQMSMEM